MRDFGPRLGLESGNALPFLQGCLAGGIPVVLLYVEIVRGLEIVKLEPPTEKLDCSSVIDP